MLISFISAKAQTGDSAYVNTLIISEARIVPQTDWGYIELTNVGTDTLDLSKFLLASKPTVTWTDYTGAATQTEVLRLTGKLAPGKSWTVVGAQEMLATDPRTGAKIWPLGRANVYYQQKASFLTYHQFQLINDPRKEGCRNHDDYSIAVWYLNEKLQRTLMVDALWY